MIFLSLLNNLLRLIVLASYKFVDDSILIYGDWSSSLFFYNFNYLNYFKPLFERNVLLSLYNWATNLSPIHNKTLSLKEVLKVEYNYPHNMRRNGVFFPFILSFCAVKNLVYKMTDLVSS